MINLNSLIKATRKLDNNLDKDLNNSLNNVTTLWVDTETSGLNPYWNDMITACFIAERNGEIIDTCELKTQPFSWESISKKAMEVHGISSLELSKFNKPEDVFLNEFLPFFKRNYNKKKYILAGHNVKFDRDFINSYWGKCKGSIEKITYFNLPTLDKLSSLDAWVSENMIDTMIMAKFCQSRNITNFIDKERNRKSVKLTVICESLGIEYDAHDAVDDIISTKIVAHRLWNLIKRNEDHLIMFQRLHPFMYNMFNGNHIKEFD